MKIISRAFNHYIKLVDMQGRKIEFKDLRKTYFTQMIMALGNRAKLFTGHVDEQVLADNYVVKEFMAGDLIDFNVFNNLPMQNSNLKFEIPHLISAPKPNLRE